MGVWGKIKKKFKSAVGSVTKVFKKVGKKIKKIGSKVWKGVKGAFGKVMGVFGKLGPIGTIALSFMLPGIGTMLGTMWTSATASLAGGAWGAFGQAIAKGMTWAAQTYTKASTFISKGVTSITDKITTSLSQVGGTITEGAKNMWASAKEFMGFKGDPLKMGEMIGQSAQKSFTDTAIAANPELIKMANASGTSVTDLALKQGQFLESGQAAFGSVLNDPKTPFTVQNNPELLKMASADKAKFTAQELAAKQTASLNTAGGNALQNNPEFLRMAGGDINKANDLLLSQEAELGRSTAAFTGKEGALTQAIQTPDQVRKASKSEKSLSDKILEGASSYFSGEEQTGDAALPPQFTSAEFDSVAAARGGVGGRGSAGGNFVDKSILALIQEQNKRIEALG